MNRKQLLLLIAACLVLGGAGLLLSKRQQAERAAGNRELGGKLFKDFPVNDVAHLRIQAAGQEVNLVKKDNDWLLKERADYAANYGEITDLLRKLWDLKVLEPLQLGAAQLPRLELLPPDKPTNAGTLVEFKDKDGKLITSLLLGKKHLRQARADTQFGGGAFPNGRYVMVGNDPATAALVTETFASVEPRPEHWLSKDFFKVEKLKTVGVVSTNAANSWKLTRDTEGGEWKLADAKGDETADAAKVSSLNYLLANPTFNDVAADWKFGDTNPPATTSTLQTFDHFTYTIKLAPKAGDDYHLQLDVTADIPKERSGASTNETQEVREKLDKEFKEKTDKLKDKLKTEQAFGKWTYVVSKWTVDALLKERKDLLAEKKEEPQKEQPQEDEPTARGEQPPKPAAKKEASPADSLVPKLNDN